VIGAWAGLDAQYFGVAQRRNRLFFVGHSGDWRYPAAESYDTMSAAVARKSVPICEH
jgi:DNA (cytosine-5)-methyltransferase 1